MRILVLDDDDMRHATFAGRFRGHEIVHARTVAEAKAALRGPRFDLVHLDHDLGDLTSETHFGGLPREANGLDVADFIARIPLEWQPRSVVIHSWNFDAARRMAVVLLDAGVHVTLAELRAEAHP